MFGLSNEVIQELQDIFKHYENIDFEQLMDIQVQIENLQLLYHVDVLNYSSIKNAGLVQQINQSGKPFYTTINNHLKSIFYEKSNFNTDGACRHRTLQSSH